MPRPNPLAQLLPALEEVLGGHLCGLEELVDGHWQLQGEGLGGTPVPGNVGKTTQLGPTPFPEAPPTGSPTLNSPKAHREQGGCQEVPQTLNVEHLLHLRPTVHLCCHTLGLNGQLWPPRSRKPATEKTGLGV